MQKSKQLPARNPALQSEGESPLVGIVSLLLGIGLIVFLGSQLWAEFKTVMSQIENGYKP